MREKTTFWLLAPTIILPSLYPLAHMPLAVAPIFAILSLIILYTTTQSTRLKPLLETPWPAHLILTGTALLAAHDNPAYPTFLPSGWNTLLYPLIHTGLLPLLTPLALAFTLFTLRSTNHPWLQINRFTICLFLGLLMWPTAGGQDLPALGLLLLSLTVLFTRQRIQWPELAALILLLATASTARAIFIYLPLLMGFSLVAVWPKRGLAVALAGLAFMFALHPTLPILPATADLLNPTTLAALTFLLIVTIQSIYHWRWWPAPQHAAWGLGAPALVIALSNLAETASFPHWYGAIYLAPALPLVTYTLLRPTFKHS